MDMSMSKTKKNKQYFTKETEDAILLYNQTEDLIERNRIYDAYIKYPFEKLAENIIHTFKFYWFDVPYEDVKHEVVAFLNEKIHKYVDPTKGKAFSYFSITAKNYLINHNNSNFNKSKTVDSIDTIDSSRSVMNEVHRDEFTAESADFLDMFVEHVDTHLSDYFTSTSDMAIADSLLEIFRRRHDIESFNKKALYILIRDRAGVKTSSITKVVNIMKKLYAQCFKEFKITGSLKFGKTFRSEFFKIKE